MKIKPNKEGHYPQHCKPIKYLLKNTTDVETSGLPGVFYVDLITRQRYIRMKPCFIHCFMRSCPQSTYVDTTMLFQSLHMQINANTEYLSGVANCLTTTYKAGIAITIVDNIRKSEQRHCSRNPYERQLNITKKSPVRHHISRGQVNPSYQLEFTKTPCTMPLKASRTIHTKAKAIMQAAGTTPTHV